MQYTEDSIHEQSLQDLPSYRHQINHHGKTFIKILMCSVKDHDFCFKRLLRLSKDVIFSGKKWQDAMRPFET